MLLSFGTERTRNSKGRTMNRIENLIEDALEAGVCDFRQDLPHVDQETGEDLQQAAKAS